MAWVRQKLGSGRKFFPAQRATHAKVVHVGSFSSTLLVYKAPDFGFWGDCLTLS